MGPPFSLLPRLRWSRVRGVENPRTARLVHHINSDGPLGSGAAASFAWLLRQTPARASQCCFMPRMRVRMSSCERLHSKYVLR